MADNEIAEDIREEDQSSPGTAAFVPDFDDDTGSQPLPVLAEPDPKPGPDSELKSASSPFAEESDTADEPAVDAAAAPVTVPGRYQYMKWWKLVLVIFAAWLPAALIGLGLFYWWFHTIDKTPTEFVVLVYVVACTVGALLLSMVPGKPLVTALSLGVMTGPFASVAAAAPLYGSYFCEHVGHCLIGVLPY